MCIYRQLKALLPCSHDIGILGAEEQETLQLGCFRERKLAGVTRGADTIESCS